MKIKNKFILTIVALNLAISACNAEPIIGETKIIKTTVIRIDVDPRDKKNFSTLYAAPSGWQILSFEPIEISKRQYAAYSFSQTPSNYTGLSKTTIEKKFDELLELAVQKNVAQKYEGSINKARKDFEKFYNMDSTTHSKISTRGTVEGNGRLFGKPGRLYLDIKVTLIYLPDKQEQFLQSIEHLKQLIQKES